MVYGYSRYLDKAGYSVSEADSLSQARQAISSQSYDAVILDMFLPDGNGADFIPELRETYPELAIVVITGAGDIPLAVNALRDGADNFLTKPVNMDEFEKEMRRYDDLHMAV